MNTRNYALRFMLTRVLLISLCAAGTLCAQQVADRAALAQAAETTAAENATDAGQALPPTDLQRIIAAGRDHNQSMALLDYLTNRIGPRLTGSDGCQTACEWTRDKFTEFGLKDAHLEKWADWPVGFNRGPWFAEMLTPQRTSLEIETDAWTAGTKGQQRGPAVMAPTNDEELEAIKDTLAGAWILSTPAPAGRGGRGRNSISEAEGQRGGGPRLEAQAAQSGSANNNTNSTPRPEPSAEQPGEGRRGARRAGRGRGTFIDPFRQKLQAAYQEAGILGTITRRASDILVTAGRRPTSADFMDNLPATPQINMAASSFDAVTKHLEAGEDVTLEFDIRNFFKKGPIPIYNVVAEIRGSEKPDEYVIVGGHIDSWDGATGATDNGTGVASTMEAARILMAAGVHPKRTIRFMLWSGEEQGLLGSRAYVTAHKDLMPKVSGVLVHDLGTQYLSSVSGLSYQLADLNEVFGPVKTLNPRFPFKVRTTDDLTSLGSDHRSFVSAGVPAYFWGQSGDGFNYWDSHHSQYDTFDKAVPEYEEHNSIVVAIAAFNIANLDHMLAREPAEAAKH